MSAALRAGESACHNGARLPHDACCSKARALQTGIVGCTPHGGADSDAVVACSANRARSAAVPVRYRYEPVQILQRSPYRVLLIVHACAAQSFRYMLRKIGKIPRTCAPIDISTP
jgi:hypothetical protein